MLENQQEVLGFSDYTLECSGLEQILADICNQGEQNGDTETEEWSESESKSSCVWENVPLVDSEGPARGSLLQQFTALLRAKRLHYMRNRWLSFLMVCVPALFVCVAMGFSKVRPPADNELPLMLTPSLYDTTDFLIPSPSLYSDRVDPSFAEHVMEVLMREKNARNWTEMDNPTCECGETRQVCHFHNTSLPQTMLLPNVTTLNDWLIKTQELYIEKRYGGFSTSLVGDASVLVSWYNNKGHHALPAFISQLNSAILKATTGNYHANITTYSHPMKISKEPLSKDTV
ncbi:unnamed protein product [Diatraea saccharalis]|uniref:Uncharacterized protein n=1 Tax=Diatraea saccharalis TaxID=40085 RepID=A0A9N9QT18_9NEOP|nr:unnamed protein product [Diatraea saccharalis]